MNKKQLILGIAIGIFVSSFVFFLSFKMSEISNNLPVSSNEKTMEIDDDYIIDRATEMGMIFFDKVLFENKGGLIDDDGDIVVSSDDYVYVTIPKNCSTEDVANILQREGLVEDKEEFVDFVVSENMATKLRYGEFLIPKNSSYEDLIELLTK